MKSLTLLFIFFLPLLALSQINFDKPVVISYLITYKHKLSLNQPIKEYSRLIVSGNHTFFQSSNEMNRDSVMVNDSENMQKLSRFYSNIKYSIETKGDSLIYNESLIKNEYQYIEFVDFDWEINMERNRIISGYNCFNATTNYGGRSWSVWFASEIPINSGPYKFKGLPGLILEAKDSLGFYTFEFNDFLNITVQK